MKKSIDKLPIFLILGIFLGILIGIFSPNFARLIKPLGDIFLNLMFTIVVPLVFVSISSAIGSMMDMKRLGNILVKTVLSFIITGLIAGVIIITVVTIFPPALNFSANIDTTLEANAKSYADLLVSSFTVPDFNELLSRRNMLPLIVFSVMFGVAVSLTGSKDSPLGKFLQNLNDVIMKMVNMVMYIAPIGLGAYFANLVTSLSFAAKEDVFGLWKTEKSNKGTQATVKVYEKNNKIQGEIVELSIRFDENGNLKKDIYNQDKSKRDRNVEGILIVSGLEYNEETDSYENGKIYDPANGKTYSCNMKLEGSKLKIRGFLGISLFGRTTTWTRK